MEISTIISTHGNVQTTLDTIDSIKHYMTNQVLVLVDAAGWQHYEPLQGQLNLLKGFYHNFNRAPYRNVALGLKTLVNHWPNSDWYCYLEYDCLIGSSLFKKDLASISDKNIWMIGNDYRDKQTVKFPLIELMLKTKFEEIVYLLGAVLFFHKDFVKKLLEVDFFEKFLYYTNEFKTGFFPGYVGPAAWDISEHLYPTLAHHWGGKVMQFAKWGQKTGTWYGNYRRYPIRWRPDLYNLEEEYVQASIMHPLKEYDSLIRDFHRKKRENNG